MVDLSESSVIEWASQLGAVRVPVSDILNAWKKIKRPDLGCLGNPSSQRLFVAYRLRDLGCFEVGFGSGVHEIETGCELHFFDAYFDTRNLTDDEFAEFMNHRKNEATVAATKLSSLIDSKPVNALAERSTYFNRDNKRNA